MNDDDKGDFGNGADCQNKKYRPTDCASNGVHRTLRARLN